MAKDSGGPCSKSRAAKRLESYNKSPKTRSTERSGEDRVADWSARGDSSRSSRARSSPPHPSSDPLDWVKAAASQRHRVEMLAEGSGEFQVTEQPETRTAKPEFRFAGNKKQYQLNSEVMDKIDKALAAIGDEERTSKLQEGKDLLVESNKLILLAEKYGWDTVACYTAEPLASDSDDEKKIRKVVKESKQLREEKKKAVVSKVLRPKGSGIPSRTSERRVILERNASYATPLAAGKQGAPRDSWSICFRCFKPGHFARDCRSANVTNGTGVIMQSSNSYQPSTQ